MLKLVIIAFLTMPMVARADGPTAAAAAAAGAATAAKEQAPEKAQQKPTPRPKPVIHNWPRLR